MDQMAQAAFVVKGPYRSSDGSFQFNIVLLLPSAIVGGVPEVIAMADVRVDNAKVCGALGQALLAVAQQLPPEIEKPVSLVS